MVNIDDPNQTELVDFALPFSGRLDPCNKWIRLARMIPWEELAKKYAQKMCPDFGRLSIKPRVAIGALIIKHYKQLSDEDTIEDIQENPYLQYFLGYSSYQFKPCFDPSLFVTIRKRLKARDIAAINELFIAKYKALRSQEKKRKRSGKGGPPQQGGPKSKDSSQNQGKLIVDATVAPSNIKYPTDLDLLNESREISEYLIDRLYSAGQFTQKPRTYRRIARRDYLRIIKKKRKSRKALRRGIKQQLQYLRRNLGHINRLTSELEDQPEALNDKEIKRLEIIRTVFQQQEAMYRAGTHSIQDRIVSIHQPQIRPIVRGKARTNVEFGAKVSLSVVAGFVYLDRLKWDAYNESLDLIAQVNKYRRRFGHYPKVVIADKIYGSRENRRYLKSKGIRFSGKKLGRPPKVIDDIAREAERLRLQEQGQRNEIEGKIGTAKTRYGLGKVMTKTAHTSENWIAMAILSLNMAAALRQLLLSLFSGLKNWLRNRKYWNFINGNPQIIPLVEYN